MPSPSPSAVTQSGRFKQGGRVYELAAINEIPPRAILTFGPDASEAMRRPGMTFDDVVAIFNRINALSDDEQEKDPDFYFLTCVLVWVSRLAVGDKITFSECLDEPFELIANPGDRKGPQKAAAKKKAKRVSGNPAKAAAARGSSTDATAAAAPAES